MPPFRIVLADDHALFREGIKKIIEAFPDFLVIGEGKSGEELLALLDRDCPDLAILDITMPKIHGIDATREAKKRFPQLKILILTMHKSKEHLKRAVEAGADGFLLKEDAHADLVSAIRAIQNGGTFISPLLTDELPFLFLHQTRRYRAKSGEGPLSPREIQILKMVAEGHSSRKIADQLLLSVRTVQHHRTNIMTKLKVKTSAELIRYAIEKGYTAGNP